MNYKEKLCALEKAISRFNARNSECILQVDTSCSVMWYESMCVIFGNVGVNYHLEYAFECMERMCAEKVIQHLVQQAKEDMRNSNADVFVKDLKNCMQKVLPTFVSPYSKDESSLVLSQFGAMRVGYFIPFSEEMTVSVTEKVLQRVGWTKEELLSVSFANLQKESMSVRDIRSVLKNPPVDMCGVSMFVVQTEGDNDFVPNGARVILHESALAQIAERIGGDFVLLPSSLHEVIVSSASDLSLQEYTSMVEEVNELCVKKEDVLFDKALFYSKKDGTLRDVKGVIFEFIA